MKVHGQPNQGCDSGDRMSRTTKYKLLEIELKTLANSVDVEGEEEKPDTIVRSY